MKSAGGGVMYRDDGRVEGIFHILCAAEKEDTNLYIGWNAVRSK